MGYPLQYSWVFLVAQMVKNLPAMRETWVQSMGWEDALREGIATYSSILAWRIPWTEESGGQQSMELQRVGHDWATKPTCTSAAGSPCSCSNALVFTVSHSSTSPHSLPRDFHFSFFSSTPLFQLLPKEHHSSLTSQSLIIILHYASPKHPMILVKFWKSTAVSRSGSLSVMSNSLPTHGLQPARLFYP